jgi:hypothetical protein
MASMLLDNDVVILNGVYWLFATKFVFSGILMFKTFITRVTFITPSHTLPPVLFLFLNFYFTISSLTLLIKSILVVYFIFRSAMIYF